MNISPKERMKNKQIFDRALPELVQYLRNEYWSSMPKIVEWEIGQKEARFEIFNEYRIYLWCAYHFFNYQLSIQLGDEYQKTNQWNNPNKEFIILKAIEIVFHEIHDSNNEDIYGKGGSPMYYGKYYVPDLTDESWAKDNHNLTFVELLKEYSWSFADDGSLVYTKEDIIYSATDIITEYRFRVSLGFQSMNEDKYKEYKFKIKDLFVCIENIHTQTLNYLDSALNFASVHNAFDESKNQKVIGKRKYKQKNYYTTDIKSWTGNVKGLVLYRYLETIGKERNGSQAATRYCAFLGMEVKTLTSRYNEAKNKIFNESHLIKSFDINKAIDILKVHLTQK